MIYDNTSAKSLCGYSIKAIEEINGAEHMEGSSVDDRPTKRQLIAIALMALGIIICFGAVGHSEFHDVWTVRHTVKCVVGLAVALASIPVSGDVTRDDVESILPKISAGKKVGRKDGNHSN